MGNLKELFEGLKPITEHHSGNLAKELRLQRMIKDVVQAIHSNLDEPRTPNNLEALAILIEEHTDYTSQLTKLQIKNI